MRYYSPRTMRNGQQATEEFKRKVVEYYLTHEFGIKEVAKHFGISASGVSQWITIFACRKQALETPQMKKEEQPLHPGEDKTGCEDIESLRAQLKEAESRLSKIAIEANYQKLRADAYDRMIDLAEQQFNIPIRKKSGAKR